MQDQGTEASYEAQTVRLAPNVFGQVNLICSSLLPFCQHTNIFTGEDFGEQAKKIACPWSGFEYFNLLLEQKKLGISSNLTGDFGMQSLCLPL